MAKGKWFDRTFALGLPVSSFPPILARLRSTPDRIEAVLDGASPDMLRSRSDAAWSVQENVGHLLDLESLWEQRLDDFDAGASVLRPADLENRKTHDANHNTRDVGDLLREFRTARTTIVERLEKMSEAELMRVGLHPRLQQPMSVVDLAFFVAEHDDHHLSTIEGCKGVKDTTALYPRRG
jgi:uncharacterized damage-inducible protein DinB